MDFKFGFQQHISFGVSDLNTNSNSFQEQDAQQRFLLISISLLQENTVSAKLNIKKERNKQKLLWLFSFM